MRLLFREGMQYAQQFIAYRTPYVPPPVEAALFLTRRCNSRCTMCNFWKYPSDKEELTTKQVLRILDELADMGVIVLSLSAEGEMTLRKDLPEIIRRTKQNRFLYSINSNFLNISDNIAQLFLRYPPYQITVGIDTLNPEKYTSIRGIEDGVSRILSAIDKLIKIGICDIVLGTVILHNNIDDLIELVDYTIKNGLKGIRFTAFQSFGFGKKWSQEELKLYTNPEFQNKLKEVITTLIQMKKNGAPIINSIPYLAMIPNSFMQDSFFPVFCHIPWRRIHVYSNGDVSLCQVMEEKAVIGNIKEDSLRNLWHSKKANKVRKVVKNKVCGGCWLSCYAETNLRFSLHYGLTTNINILYRAYRI